MPHVSWSHTALKDYENCARKYHEVRVLKKFPFEETEASRYGNNLHKAAELYVKDGTPLPPEFDFIKPVVDSLMSLPGRKLAEYKMTLDANLNPVSWFDKKAWVRGIADFLSIDDDNLTAYVADYKTGSNKYPDREQLRLMAMMVFAHFPHLRRVKSMLLFVVKNDAVKDQMMVAEAESEWWRYRERIGKIESSLESGVWNPNKNPLCGYCPCTSCEFNKRH